MARKQTLMRYMVKRVGARRAYRAMAFIIAWEAASDDLGRVPSVDEYAVWWKLDRRTAFREQELFREIFEGRYSTPSELIDLARAQRVPVQKLVIA